MKRIKSSVVLIGLLFMVFSTQVLAEKSMAQSLQLSGYRCRNSTCYAYLEKKGSLKTCATCSADLYAYKCNYCGIWYAICDNGHYGTIDGR